MHSLAVKQQLTPLLSHSYEAMLEGMDVDEEASADGEDAEMEDGDEEMDDDEDDE